MYIYLEIINFYIFTKGCFKYMFCLLFVFGLLICTVLCFYLNEIKVNGDTVNPGGISMYPASHVTNTDSVC